MSVRTGGGGLASSQKCKVLDFGHILEKGKNGFWTSRLAISCQKAVGAKAIPSELTPNVLYLPLPPKLLAVPEGKQTVKWASKTAQGSSRKGVGPFLGSSQGIGVV